MTRLMCKLPNGQGFDRHHLKIENRQLLQKTPFFNTKMGNDLNGICENEFGDEFDEPTHLQITETF